MWILGFRRAIGWLVKTEERFTTKVKSKELLPRRARRTRRVRTEERFTTKGSKVEERKSFYRVRARRLRAKEHFTTKGTKITKVKN